MFARNTALAAILLFSLPGLTLADQNADNLDIQVALNKDVRSGMSIDQAVTNRISHSPDDATKIATTALGMLETLPSRACIERTVKEKVTRSPQPDYQACSTRIIRAAILAGADPVTIAKATAAGMTNKVEDQPQYKAKDIYLRRLFLFGSS